MIRFMVVDILCHMALVCLNLARLMDGHKMTLIMESRRNHRKVLNAERFAAGIED